MCHKLYQSERKLPLMTYSYNILCKFHRTLTNLLPRALISMCHLSYSPVSLSAYLIPRVQSLCIYT